MPTTATKPSFLAVLPVLTLALTLWGQRYAIAAPVAFDILLPAVPHDLRLLFKVDEDALQTTGGTGTLGPDKILAIDLIVDNPADCNPGDHCPPAETFTLSSPGHIFDVTFVAGTLTSLDVFIPFARGQNQGALILTIRPPASLHGLEYDRALQPRRVFSAAAPIPLVISNQPQLLAKRAHGNIAVIFSDGSGSSRDERKRQE